MSRLTRVIAPMLRSAGLDIREVSRADGEVRELVVTNPRFPAWGRVVIDCDGLMEWDYRGEISEDAGASRLAMVIIAVMAAARVMTASGTAAVPASSLPNATGHTHDIHRSATGRGTPPLPVLGWW